MSLGDSGHLLTPPHPPKEVDGIELLAAASIIKPMRRLILFFMIALLAVRGWAGTVMSVEMSVQGLRAAPAMVAQVNVGESVKASDAAAVAHGRADCPDHAAMQADAHEASNTGSHCNTCVACQICHTVALTGITPVKLAPVGAHSPIVSGGTRFSSAALPSGFKPPIS